MDSYLSHEESLNLPVGTFVLYSTQFNESDRLAVVLGYEGLSKQIIVLQTAEASEPKRFDVYDFQMDGNLSVIDKDKALELYEQHRRGLDAISRFTREILREKGIHKGITE